MEENELVYSYNLDLTCEHYYFENLSNDSSFCVSENIADAFTSDSEDVIEGNLKVEKDDYYTDVSPAAIIFLGLLPHAFSSYYTFSGQVITPEGTELSIDKTYKIVQYWSTWETFKSIFGLTISQNEAVSSMIVDLEKSQIHGQSNNRQ
jgi:hypothetical protein